MGAFWKCRPLMDVAVDIRKGSPTYARWLSVRLDDENKRQLLVPKGFAHGFVALTDDVEVQYKVDAPYSREHDRSILYSDPTIGVEWGTNSPTLSEKDMLAPLLEDSDHGFTYDME